MPAKNLKYKIIIKFENLIKLFPKELIYVFYFIKYLFNFYKKKINLR